MVVEIGETEILEPTKFPGFHVYEFAPLAVRVAEDPKQIGAG